MLTWIIVFIFNLALPPMAHRCHVVTPFENSKDGGIGMYPMDTLEVFLYVKGDSHSLNMFPCTLILLRSTLNFFTIINQPLYVISKN